MERTLLVILALLHSLLAATHGYAHFRLGIFGSPAQTAFVLVVIHFLPLLALGLAWRDLRLSRGLLCAALVLSAAYGIQHHYLTISPDHVDHLPAAPLATTFRVTAHLLALADVLGSVGLLFALLRETKLLPGGRHVLLVDGHCVFCNRLVSFIVRRDKLGLFYFAPVQSNHGRELLARHGHDVNDIDTIYLVANAGTAQERLCLDGEAGREIWPRLFVLGYLTRLVPLALLNVQYRLFAAVRYRLFGRYESCYVPSAEERSRLLR